MNTKTNRNQSATSSGVAGSSGSSGGAGAGTRQMRVKSAYEKELEGQLDKLKASTQVTITRLEGDLSAAQIEVLRLEADVTKHRLHAATLQDDLDAALATSHRVAPDVPEAHIQAENEMSVEELREMLGEMGKQRQNDIRARHRLAVFSVARLAHYEDLLLRLREIEEVEPGLVNYSEVRDISNEYWNYWEVDKAQIALWVGDPHKNYEILSPSYKLGTSK
jgi:hypothetical protein